MYFLSNQDTGPEGDRPAEDPRKLRNSRLPRDDEPDRNESTDVPARVHYAARHGRNFEINQSDWEVGKSLGHPCVREAFCTDVLWCSVHTALPQTNLGHIS